MRWIFPAKVNSSIVPRARARPAPSRWAAYDDDEPELPGRGRACGAADRSDDPHVDDARAAHRGVDSSTSVEQQPGEVEI